MNEFWFIWADEDIKNIVPVPSVKDKGSGFFSYYLAFFLWYFLKAECKAKYSFLRRIRAHSAALGYGNGIGVLSTFIIIWQEFSH